MVYRYARYTLIVLSVFSGIGVAEEETLFSTWATFEADKCASIWLIKRFIAPSAEIRFYPPNEPITAGIPFDTPEAHFRRYHNRATFATLVSHYQLNDPQLVTIGRIIHDIEINLWEKKVMAQTGQVMNDMEALGEHLETTDIVAACVAYFDALYAQLGSTEK